jgi:hypothetical protein
MFKKLFFQGRVQEAADQIINLLMYCTFRHLLCHVCASWPPLHRRRWLIDSLLIKVQSPGRASDASSNNLLCRRSTSGLRSSATAVTAPPAARRNRSTGRARCAAARRHGVRARAALAGLARAEILPRTSRDGLMMDGWMGTPYATVHLQARPPHIHHAARSTRATARLGRLVRCCCLCSDMLIWAQFSF